MKEAKTTWKEINGVDDSIRPATNFQIAAIAFLSGVSLTMIILNIYIKWKYGA